MALSNERMDAFIVKDDPNNWREIMDLMRYEPGSYVEVERDDNTQPPTRRILGIRYPGSAPLIPYTDEAFEDRKKKLIAARERDEAKK